MAYWFEIRTPQSTQWQPQIAATFIQALFEHVETNLDLEFVCTKEKIRVVIGSSEENQLSPDNVASLVSAYYPGSEVVEPDWWGGKNYPYFRRSVILARNATGFFETATSVHQHKSRDPLATVLQAAEQLKDGELLTYHVHIVGIANITEEDIFELMTISGKEAGIKLPLPESYYRRDVSEVAAALFGRWLATRKLNKERFLRFEEKDTERYIAKLSQKLAETAVFLRFETPRRERLKFLTSVVTAVKRTSDLGIAKLIDGVDRQTKVTDEGEDEKSFPLMILYEWREAEAGSREALKISQNELVSLYTADELATLWHLPHAGCTGSKIAWADESQKPMSEALKTLVTGIVIGLNRKDKVRIPDDERTQHALIVGKPGVGKSCTMLWMILQDLIAGRGLCLIDPHGTLMRNVLQYGIPKGREADVVVLDFANSKNPPPFNPLYRPDKIEQEVATTLVMSILTKVYDELAFREMADTLQMALQTLMAEKQPTLLDVEKVFDNLDYRDRLVQSLDDFIVTNFWEKFDNLSDGKRAEMMRPILHRLRPFYRNKHLRAIACHSQPLNLWQLIAENKIILVSLSADEAQMPSEQRQILGGMLVTQIEMAVMAGAVQHPPYHLYIDEAQNFVTTRLPVMLAEARKQGLGITLANQYLRQLTGETLEAVEGTIATLIAFEVGEADARAFAPYFRPAFDVADLIALGKYRAAISLRYQNQRQRAFTLNTFPPPTAETQAALAAATKREQSIYQMSVEKYTPKTYSEVDEWLRQRYNPPKPGSEVDDNAFLDAQPKT